MIDTDTGLVGYSYTGNDDDMQEALKTLQSRFVEILGTKENNVYWNNTVSLIKETVTSNTLVFHS